MGVSGVQILMIVIVVAVLFMGPSRIPGLGKSLGQAIRGFKKGISEDEVDITDSVEQEKIDQAARTPDAATDKNSEKQSEKV